MVRRTNQWKDADDDVVAADSVGNSDDIGESDYLGGFDNLERASGGALKCAGFAA
jgi:hypothetical protein